MPSKSKKKKKTQENIWIEKLIEKSVPMQLDDR